MLIFYREFWINAHFIVQNPQSCEISICGKSWILKKLRWQFPIRVAIVFIRKPYVISVRLENAWLFHYEL